MTLRVWPDADFATNDTGFWPWLKAFAFDFIGHKQQPHPRRFVELADVDVTTIPDGAVFQYDAASSSLKPVLGVAPASHASTHGPGGSDPIPGLADGAGLVFD